MGRRRASAAGLFVVRIVSYDNCSHGDGRAIREVQLRDAKATLSAVVDKAEHGEPVVITRHGKLAAVIVGFEEWQRLAQVPSFGRLLMSAPLEAGDLPERDQSALRESGL